MRSLRITCRFTAFFGSDPGCRHFAASADSPARLLLLFIHTGSKRFILCPDKAAMPGVNISIFNKMQIKNRNTIPLSDMYIQNPQPDHKCGNIKGQCPAHDYPAGCPLIKHGHILR